MLYNATVVIDLPGNTPEDALARLKARLPGWPVELVEINEAAVQPPALIGTIDIKLPNLSATAR